MRGWLTALCVLAAVTACGKGDKKPSASQSTTANDARSVAPTAQITTDGAATPRAKARHDAAADAVSNATPMDDPGSTAAGPARVPADRVKNIAKPLRGLAVEAAPVFVGFGSNAAALIKRSLDTLKVQIPTDRRVVLKVNLGGFDNHGTVGRITAPAFVDALIGELKRRGVTDIAVADGASRGAKDMERVVRKTGYEPVLSKHKVPFVNLNHYGKDDKRPGPWHVSLPWAKHVRWGLVLSDALVGTKRIYLINVPKLKAHRFAVMSVSIKNMMGAVMMHDPSGRRPAWKRRGRMHGELTRTALKDMTRYRAALDTFSERLADLYGVVTPDLVIVDGMPPTQGNGFKHAIPYGGRKLVIASRNGCYADYVSAEYFGLHDSSELERHIGSRMPPAIAAVAKRYYGGVDKLRQVQVVGDTKWRTERRRTAWLQGMAKFEVGTKPAGK